MTVLLSEAYKSQKKQAPPELIKLPLNMAGKE